MPVQICITPSLIHTVSLASHVSTRLLIYLPPRSFITICKAHCVEDVESEALISVIVTTLGIRHSFTLSLQAQNLPFQQIHPTLILLRPWTAFTITGPDRTYHASRSIFSSFFSVIFLFVPCGGLIRLHESFLLHVKYTISYRIISCVCYDICYDFMMFVSVAALQDNGYS